MIDLEAAVVFNESEFLELVHEEIPATGIHRYTDALK
jgi:hypothetical protein